jgi:hypothetical protein
MRSDMIMSDLHAEGDEWTQLAHMCVDQMFTDIYLSHLYRYVSIKLSVM